jgi:hypothetical protein
MAVDRSWFFGRLGTDEFNEGSRTCPLSFAKGCLNVEKSNCEFGLLFLGWLVVIAIGERT